MNMINSLIFGNRRLARLILTQAILALLPILYPSFLAARDEGGMTLEIRPGLIATIPEDSLDDVYSVAFSSDGKLLLSGGSDDTVRIWDLEKRRLARTYRGLEYNVDAVALSPDGRLVAGGGEPSTVLFWNRSSGKVWRKLVARHRWIESIDFLSDSQQDSRQGLWRVRHDARRGRRQNARRVTRGIRRVIVSSGDDGGRETALYELPSGKLRAAWPASLAAISRDGKLVALSYDDDRLLIFNLQTMTAKAIVGAKVISAAFSPGNRILATIEDGPNDTGILRFRDLETGKVAGSLVDERYLSTVAFIDKGRKVLTVSAADYDRRETANILKTRDIFTGKIISTCGLEHAEAACFQLSSDGRTLATSSMSGTIKLWNVKDGRNLLIMTSMPSTNSDFSKEWLVYAGDGSYNASAGAMKFSRVLKRETLWSDRNK
jgi:WD40 repeat protein